MIDLDTMARHVRDALTDSEELANGDNVMPAHHARQLLADFEAWNEADDAKTSTTSTAIAAGEVERIGLAVADLVEQHLTSPAMIWGLPELPESWMTELRSILVAALEGELAGVAVDSDKDAVIAKLQQRGATELDVILRLTVQLRDAIDAIRDLLPALGNGYHPAYRKGAKVLRTFEEGAQAAAPKAASEDGVIGIIMPADAKYRLGDDVQKKSGSMWHGKVVGFYSTKLTRIGYCIESAFEHGSVQLYPEAALLPWSGLDTPPDLGCDLPPDGWWCSRKPGHDGPCAAVASEDGATGLLDAIEALFDQAFSDGIRVGKTGDDSLLADSSGAYARSVLNLLAASPTDATGAGEDPRSAFYAESIVANDLLPTTQVVAIDSFLRAVSRINLPVAGETL